MSLRKIRDILWDIHEVQIQDSFTGKSISMQTDLEEFNKTRVFNKQEAGKAASLRGGFPASCLSKTRVKKNN